MSVEATGAGRAKMIANCITFAVPTARVYNVLPPSREELSEVLACVFIGSSPPTETDYERMPMLVRRNKVKDALEWLKLNHVDYEDLGISYDNLDSYPLSGVPVIVEFRKLDGDGNKIATAMSKFDNDMEEGTTEGPCPFTVHGLTGDEYEKMSIDALKVRALRHLEKNGCSLAVGHDASPQSVYNNPQLYPQMFPWLFPYGKGGIGQKVHSGKLSAAEHKKLLLMYHDKRFQTDYYFPMIAFNQEQIKKGATGSFLLAKRQNFTQISERLLSVDPDVLESLSKRLAKGERVVPETDAEKCCYSILADLDHVGGHVKGSLTNKKYMRNEIWSLVSFKGAPSWFITLSPADSKHPLCMYYADTDTTFKPDLRLAKDRDSLVLRNPAAAARFFDYVVRSMIKNVLGVGAEHEGLYGKTSAYYGTVEQQGRLTLHLHLLLWIDGVLSPQDIRDKLMSPDSQFQKSLVEYLEGVHSGELKTGSLAEVLARQPAKQHLGQGIHKIVNPEASSSAATEDVDYQDPTQTMPMAPPPECRDHPNNDGIECVPCTELSSWWSMYDKVTDDLIARSNVHVCRASFDKKRGKKKTKVNDQVQLEADASPSIPVDSEDPIAKAARYGQKGCLNEDGVCLARFPRDVRETTVVSHTDGHVFMKKLEPMINTFTPALTYLSRCNTDVSSLLSGTSIKAIISYVTDYVTKPTLKTHQVFSSAYDVFSRHNNDPPDEDKSRSEKARGLIMRIVNALASKMEIGSPMACLYLLDNPDHYTGHTFVPFWWRSYVQSANKSFQQRDSDTSASCASEGVQADQVVDDGYEDNVVLGLEDGRYVGRSVVDDYIYRPECYANLNVLQWIQTSHKKKRSKKSAEAFSLLVASGGVPSASKSKYVAFHPSHPLYLTHEVHCDFDKISNVVPNFLGGSLPRRDQGDREHYCSTMLTLFKPWRTGLDLKSPEQSWDEAFVAYDFSPDAKSIMNNFNLRYECLDARDDFHGEMNRKTKLAAEANYRMSDDEYSSEDYNSEDDYVERPGRKVKYSQLGPGALKRIADQKEVAGILSTAGWLDNVKPAEGNACSNAAYSMPSVKLAPTAWKNKLQECRDAILAEKRARFHAALDERRRGTKNVPEDGQVKIVDADYFRRDFKAKNIESANISDAIVKEFNLNAEQERAFRIIANHSAAASPDQLKMYLGGMGGTGKTQVIKALVEMFKRKNESHRLLVVAPTGTAAALLNGSTYHSAFGLRSKGKNDAGFMGVRSDTIHELREKLAGVEYVFLDEVSMVACHELHAISARLSDLTNIHDKPFGGINIIFAGDFAQLPPVKGVSLYGALKEQGAVVKVRDQESTIGKLIWHQVTTVVILKQNMRQRTQSQADGKLRTALENMRYAACTPQDLTFLRTLVAGKAPGKPKLCDPNFRNVSVITAWNAQKDRINELGSARFSADTGMPLVDFYSVDKTSSEIEEETGVRRRGRKPTKKRGLKRLDLLDKNALWNSPPCTSEHVPGKLSLCIGLPVIIRHNYAMELCITKGQEGTVCGWDSSQTVDGNMTLETLYVKLTAPPKDVHIPGLEPNVVPIPKMTTPISCKMPDDSVLRISRTQVPVLPCFSMTDYASQGKTRVFNVADLGHCRTTQSYYMCLSRSASAAGTILVQPFSDHLITKGLHGRLRQEFRELEMLNDITRLRYENKAPETISGSMRNPLIRSYQLWRGDKCEGSDWHPSLKWNANESKLVSEHSDDRRFWQDNVEQALTDVGSHKRKDAPVQDHRDSLYKSSPVKKSKVAVQRNSSNDESLPIGMIWDSVNYSCSYDSLFTVLFNIWSQDILHWSAKLSAYSSFMSTLCDSFMNVRMRTMTLEQARDRVRKELTDAFPQSFPVGATYTYLDGLILTMVGDKTFGSCVNKCARCGNVRRGSHHFFGVLNIIFRDLGEVGQRAGEYSTTEAMDMHINRVASTECSDCAKDGIRSYYIRESTIDEVSDLVILGCGDGMMKPDIELNIRKRDGTSTKLVLAGVIYGNGHHFVSRYVNPSGTVYFHDGQTTRRNCTEERRIDLLSDTRWLRNCRDSPILFAIYTTKKRVA